MVTFINLLYNIFFVLILARVILSFIQGGHYHPIGRAIFNATEPILAPIRNLLPPMAGVDFSPIVVLLALGLLRGVLISLLA
jgi:YggT family protein